MSISTCTVGYISSSRWAPRDDGPHAQSTIAQFALYTQLHAECRQSSSAVCYRLKLHWLDLLSRLTISGRRALPPQTNRQEIEPVEIDTRLPFVRRRQRRCKHHTAGCPCLYHTRRQSMCRDEIFQVQSSRRKSPYF